MTFSPSHEVYTCSTGGCFLGSKAAGVWCWPLSWVFTIEV